MRLRRLLVATAATSLIGLSAGPAVSDIPSAASTHASGATAVIVQAASPAAAGAAVRRVGGTVTRDLPIVRGVAASVPATAVDRLAQAAGIRAVTPDETVRVSDARQADSDGGASSYLSPMVNEVNAPRLWVQGVLGQGVRVALVDTGVTPSPDLGARVVPVADPVGTGRTVECVNFSGELGCGDSYGHGTFIAGLIAGDGKSADYRYPGVAPRSEIVSIKIAGRDGSADVSKVLAAIQWVVSFKDAYGIQVLNLSLGTDSTVSYKLDPLNYAVERAWASGLVVVVAASNRGPAARTISKPADDPLVITVGAVDDRGTSSIGDDTVPAFSGRGPTATDGLAKPDVAAPGTRVASLRSAGSLIEEAAPGGGAGLPAAYRRGSGTSMSAGVVSGAAALIRQANPTWTPDRVKFALMSTARSVPGASADAVGRGIIDVYSAARTAPAGLANVGVTAIADIEGTLEGSRGTVFVTGAPCSTVEKILDGEECIRVKGDETAQGGVFDTDAFVGDPWSGSSWYTSQWVGSSWYGSSWYGSSWYGEPATLDPFGVRVSGSSWYGVWS